MSCLTAPDRDLCALAGVRYRDSSVMAYAIYSSTLSGHASRHVLNEHWLCMAASAFDFSIGKSMGVSKVTPIR